MLKRFAWMKILRYIQKYRSMLMIKLLLTTLMLGLVLVSKGYTESSIAPQECFIIKDMNRGKILFQEGDIDQRRSPCSTFKIALSLMGYDAGILQDEKSPEWAYEEKYQASLDIWKTSHNPRTWMQNSCIWYSQILTQLLGYESFKNRIALLSYGNQDISGDPGQNNGLTSCWLSSSLKISPREQVAFLQKLLKGELPFSSHAIEMTKRILYVEDLPQEWKLFGKTGSGSQTNLDGTQINDRQIGWFVGWIIKQDTTLIFAYSIQDQQKEELPAGKRARTRMKEILLAKILGIRS